MDPAAKMVDHQLTYLMNAAISSGDLGGQKTELMLRSSLWKLPGSGVIASGFLPFGPVYMGLPYINWTWTLTPFSTSEST